MAPSRGFQHAQTAVRNSISTYKRVWTARRTFASFSEALANPANKVQSYISSSKDPYLNLSIEDHILRTSPPDSAVLFLYTNRPCVVIGRNQNPWLEVNLGILKALESRHGKEIEPPALGNVDLVRRRSGGGTVFHDEGNVNWSITSPWSDFTRDKHAEMVVRGLRKLGVDRARVNERHDIVLDQGRSKSTSDPEDTHRTPYTVDGSEPRPLKVAGSAYKMTRARALHHGTCLLSSPNLHIIPDYLHSPARPYLKAKGVDSVSSPVGNIGLKNAMFEKYVQDEFAAMYGHTGGAPTVQVVGEEQMEVPEINKGYKEMRTLDWMYSQTPQFTLSSVPINGGAYRNAGPLILPGLPEGVIFNMTVHHGIIKECSIEGPVCSSEDLKGIQTALVNQKVQDIRDWNRQLMTGNQDGGPVTTTIAKWLSEVMPVVDFPEA